MLKSTIFREYDIRGVADAELADADVEQLGRGFGTYLQRHAGKKINLGRDTRLSSPRLRDALARGLKATGCEVTDIGVVPTPVLYYSVFHLKADGAVMITGSHNPAEFNGFKTVCGASTIIPPPNRSVGMGPMTLGVTLRFVSVVTALAVAASPRGTTSTANATNTAAVIRIIRSRSCSQRVIVSLLT